MPGHGPLTAIGIDQALRAEGGQGLTDALTEGNKDAIQVFPISFRQQFPQRTFCFVGIFRRHQPPAISDSVNVGINANAVFIEPAGQYEISGLSSDSF